MKDKQRVKSTIKIDKVDISSVNTIDKIIGNNLKVIRILNKVTQQNLGEIIGITFQQVQKYESGKNRLKASQLFEIAQFFKIPVSNFFSEKFLDHLNTNKTLPVLHQKTTKFKYSFNNKEEIDIKVSAREKQLIDKLRTIPSDNIQTTIINFIDNLLTPDLLSLSNNFDNKFNDNVSNTVDSNSVNKSESIENNFSSTKIISNLSSTKLSQEGLSKIGASSKKSSASEGKSSKKLDSVNSKSVSIKVSSEEKESLVSSEDKE